MSSVGLVISIVANNLILHVLRTVVARVTRVSLIRGGTVVSCRTDDLCSLDSLESSGVTLLRSCARCAVRVRSGTRICPVRSDQTWFFSGGSCQAEMTGWAYVTSSVISGSCGRSSCETDGSCIAFLSSVEGRHRREIAVVASVAWDPEWGRQRAIVPSTAVFLIRI